MAARADGTAETRAYKVIALAFGPAAVVFGLLDAGAISSQWSFYQLWWSLLAVLALFGGPLMLCAMSFFASAKRIRLVSAVGAVAYLASICLLGPALHGQHLVGEASPWLLGMATIGSTLAALAWRMPIAAAAILIGSAFVAVDRVAAGGTVLLGTGLQDALYTFTFSVVFAALAQVATRSGYLVDDAAVSARSEAVVAAAARARLQERGRINALVHDNVLATLLAAGRGRTREEHPLVREQARDALAELSRLQGDAAPPKELAALDFTWALQSMTTDTSPNAIFSHDVEAKAMLPSEVTEAISEALLEALRNSEQHAGRGDRAVSRSVHIRVRAENVEVTALDDGVGFDPSRVAPTRLGVSASILDRMRWVPGGDARLVSQPGVGTRVSLTWTGE